MRAPAIIYLVFSFQLSTNWMDKISSLMRRYTIVVIAITFDCYLLNAHCLQKYPLDCFT